MMNIYAPKLNRVEAFDVQPIQIWTLFFVEMARHMDFFFNMVQGKAINFGTNSLPYIMIKIMIVP